MGGLGFGWLWNQKEAQKILWPLRKMFNFNEKLSQAYFDPKRLAPSFSKALAKVPRINGKVGLIKPPELRNWHLEIQGLPQSAARKLVR